MSQGVVIRCCLPKPLGSDLLFSQETIKNKNEMSPVQIITKENVQDYSTEGWQ